MTGGGSVQPVGALASASNTVAPFAGDPAEWDVFTRAQPAWTHFHLYGWRSIMERSFGHECIYVAARNVPGELTGILPLVRIRSRLFGHYLVSMPFVNYGGPLGADAATVDLAAFAEAVARESGVTLLEMRSRYQLPLDMAVSHRKVTTLLDLPKNDPDVLLRSLSRGLRNRIRKAEKSDVEVRFGADQVGPFHEVFARHMRFLGTPTQSRAFFHAMASTFPHDSLFACAYLGSTPVACGAGFFWNGEYEMTWSAALREYDHAKPNMGLYWAVMKHVIARGCRIFNFGRSTPGSGTHEFKRHWGARDETLWWYQRARVGAPSSTPSPEAGAYAWGPRIWQRLPLALTNRLGPHIVRFIP
ncbi:MAG: FemAB family PEP-CTERM system-associated protein [Gemmatimonadaceae bacterium]